MAPTAPRTAPIPSEFWTKHNSERSEKMRFKAPRGVPLCTVCGAALNPAKATTVAVIHGGSSFMHPDDVTEADMNDGGFMGCWDLGSSCVRLAPARVRAPYADHPGGSDLTPGCGR